MILNWAKIKLLILDVDGVLTDGKVYYGAEGECLKCFYVRDGLGIRDVLAAGIEVAVISGRGGAFTERRMADLGIKYTYWNVTDKLTQLTKLQEQLQISYEEMAYMGDDTVDIATMKRVGIGVAVADAEPSVLTAAQYITMHKGGRGAVREICDLILSKK